MFDYTFEQLGQQLEICVTEDHKFGTDAFLLSDFAQIRRKDLVCDLCTGCGIVALLWFRDSNSPKKVYCVDIQEKAIEQLKITIQKANLQEQIIPLLADLKQLEIKSMGQFDVITCNPPYKTLDTGIISTEQSQKIARHELLCNVDDICKTSAKLLKFGGKFCICGRAERLLDFLLAMRNHGIEPKRLRFAQNTKDHAPWLFLLEGKKGTKPFLRIDKPLILKDEQGNFTEELLRIYKRDASNNRWIV